MKFVECGGKFINLDAIAYYESRAVEHGHIVAKIFFQVSDNNTPERLASIELNREESRKFLEAVLRMVIM